eukprot:407833_1
MFSKRKRKLSEENKQNQPDETPPPTKKLKLYSPTDEDTKEASFNETSLQYDAFLSMITSNEKHNYNKLSNIKYLVLTCSDNLNYDFVLNKYLKDGKFEKMMPHLTKIETYSNFLFDELCGFGISHSKLQQIVITDCTTTVNINCVHQFICNFQSLKSIHCFCFYINYELFSSIKQHKLHKIDLISHLPTAYAIVGQFEKTNVKLSEINTTFNLNVTHQTFEANITDPRFEHCRYASKNLRQVYTDDNDCWEIDNHISLTDLLKCPWCAMFQEKKKAVDPADIIIKYGIKYTKEVRIYEDCHHNTKYLLQFPIGRFDEYLQFDGFMFWSGMPDEPKPEKSFQDTQLFKQNKARFKPDTIYYLTHEECQQLNV